MGAADSHSASVTAGYYLLLVTLRYSNSRMDSFMCVLSAIFATLFVSAFANDCNPSTCLMGLGQIEMKDNIPTKNGCAQIAGVTTCAENLKTNCPDADTKDLDKTLMGMKSVCDNLDAIRSGGQPGGQPGGQGQPMMSECVKKVMECQKGNEKYLTEEKPSKEDLESNKDNICTIVKEMKMCLESVGDCTEQGPKMIKEETSKMAETCAAHFKKQASNDDGATDSATSASLSLLLVALPVVMQALVWM